VGLSIGRGGFTTTATGLFSSSYMTSLAARDLTERLPLGVRRIVSSPSVLVCRVRVCRGKREECKDQESKCELGKLKDRSIKRW
jgi:hypothetical protein